MPHSFYKIMFTPRKRKVAVVVPNAPRKKSKKDVSKLLTNRSTAVSLYRSPVSPIPQRKVVTLRYAESNVSLDPAAGIPADYFFRANDLFDPNYTGAGHQPLGFDQWMALYTKFSVLNSKITVKFTNGADATTADWIVMVRRTTTPTSSTTNEILESNACSWTAKERENVVTLVNAYSFKQEHKGLGLEDGTMFGTNSASPTNEQYFHVSAINAVTTIDVTPLIATVVIEYETMFFDPRVLSTS